MTAAADSRHYYVPHETHWPIIGSVGLFALVGVIVFAAGREEREDLTSAARELFGIDEDDA